MVKAAEVEVEAVGLQEGLADQILYVPLVLGRDDNYAA